jgi:hypothetical protein
MQRKIGPVVMFGATAALIAVLASWLAAFFGPTGFADGKSILAHLQGLELQHRHEKVPTPGIFAAYADTGPILVVATLDPSFPYAWMAANAPSCGEYPCMVAGDARIEIGCDELKRIVPRMRTSVPHVSV